MSCAARLHHTSIVLLASVALGAPVIAIPAAAQSRDARPRDSQGASAAQTSVGAPSPVAIAQGEVPDADDGAINEIVVTAQRVTENLQDVPLSVTAVTGDSLIAANITDASRLDRVTPGLTIGRSGSDLRPAIRGVRTESVGANADPTIGFFIDGVYQSRTSQALASFVDLERVEILRGPQGTLFGRNTFGGAINLVPAKPKSQFAGRIDLLYGSFDRRRADGFINIPLGEGIALRVAGMAERADGYVKNIGQGNDLGDEDQYYLRPSLRFKPSSTFTIDLSGQYWSQGGAGLSPFGYKSRGTLVDPTLASATNSGRSLNGVYFPINSRIRDGIPDVNGFDIGVPVLKPYEVDFDAIAQRRTKLKSATATAELDLGPVILKSISGFTDFLASRRIDNDFSPFPVAVDTSRLDVRTYSQELQLIGRRGSALEWIVGGYYFDDSIREVLLNDQNNSFPAPGTPAAAGPPFQAGTPSQGPFLTTRADSLTPVNTTTKSYAAFAQGTFHLTEQFSATAGMRYTEDKKTYTRRFRSAPNLTLADAAAAPPTAQTEQRATFDKITWKAGVNYEPHDDHLVYASVSTGFTSGGFNGGTFSPAPGQTLALPPFGPQTITAYELGTKNRVGRGAIQLNGAIFYNDLNDVHVQTQTPFAGTVISSTNNIGKARSYGAEVELLMRPRRQIEIGVNFTYLNAKYTTLLLTNPFPNPALTCPGGPIPLRVGTLRCVELAPGVVRPLADLGGASIPFSPKFIVNTHASYEIKTSVGSFTPFASLYFNSGYYNLDFNTQLDRQKAYTQVDLRLTWLSPNKRYSAQAFVENLGNTVVNQRGVLGVNQSLNANYAPPRRFGVRVGAKF